VDNPKKADTPKVKPKRSAVENQRLYLQQQRAMTREVEAYRARLREKYIADQRRVVFLVGEPCRVTSSDDAYLGHMEIWYYSQTHDCYFADGVYDETYTFFNGHLRNHTKI